MIQLGFTGSRCVPTAYQFGALRKLLDAYIETGVPVRGHHGGCIGADAAFHKMCVQHGMFMVLHPPTNSSLQHVVIADEVRPRFPYLTRNQHIVDATDILIAMPAQAEEILRSGTWSTVRYAHKMGGRVIILPPKPGKE